MFPRLSPLPIDGAWKHIFFTYDGSGRASGVKIFVDGKAVGGNAHRGRQSRPGQPSAPRFPCNSAGAIRKSILPSEARYQDIRLYSRAVNPGRSRKAALRRLCRGNLIASPNPVDAEDQWHVMSEFYLNHEWTRLYQAIQREIAPLDRGA